MVRKILTSMEWSDTFMLSPSILFLIDKHFWLSWYRRILLSRHFTLQAFYENIPTYNKICTLSGVIGFNSSVAALLSLDKAFSYRFSMCQRAKCINFNEMIAVLQALARWIEIFKGSHLHIFCDNFPVTQGLHKNSIYGEAI